MITATAFTFNSSHDMHISHKHPRGPWGEKKNLRPPLPSYSPTYLPKTNLVFSLLPLKPCIAFISLNSANHVPCSAFFHIRCTFPNHVYYVLKCLYFLYFLRQTLFQTSCRKLSGVIALAVCTTYCFFFHSPKSHLFSLSFLHACSHTLTGTDTSESSCVYNTWYKWKAA